MSRVHLLGVVLALTAIVSGCSYSVPLGGIAPGRGQPVGRGMLQLGMSRGLLPELAGTLPAVTDGSGTVVNPVPEGQELRTSARGLDWIGITLGLADDVDLGLNFSRGLHAFVRVLEGSMWSVTLSPAVFRYTSRNQFSPQHDRLAGVTNLNLTGLLSLDPLSGQELAPELYVGGGVSRYGGWVETDVARTEHVDAVPSVLAGLRFESTRCTNGCETGRRRTHNVGVEVVGTWVSQRNGRRDLVPVVRAHVAIGLELLPPRLRR